jgi:hypothetical protein
MLKYWLKFDIKLKIIFMKRTILLLQAMMFVNIGVLFCNNSLKAKADAQTYNQKLDKRFFIENKGQWHSDVLYLCRMVGLDAWITKYGVNYTFYKIERNANASKSNDLFHPHDDEYDRRNDILLGHRVLFELQGHNPNPAKEGKQKQEGYYNYLIGNDPSKHASFVGLYKEAVVKNVYQGIDIRYYFDKGSLRYDFIVHPNADPNQIKFTLRGQDKAYTKGDSKLCFTTRFGEVQMADLQTYQENKTVASKFVKSGNTWQVELAAYDKSKTLVIDPLVYSTFIGDLAYDRAWSITIDNLSNAYITGQSNSPNYDITTGAYQTTLQGGTDIIITKLNASGTALVYSTFIGGSNNDVGMGIILDNNLNVYVTGYTESSDYPTTTGAYQTSSGGSRDVILSKLNTTGSALIYSTYIGGSNMDTGSNLALDNNGDVYIAGYTTSTNYPTVAGGYQVSKDALNDAFVTKINASGTALIYSTFVGGNADDYATDIAIDNSGNAYISGVTGSTNFDVTTGAFRATYQGGALDAFVTKLNSSGSSLVYSTYLGGTGSEQARAIYVDANTNAYVTGYTGSNNFSTTTGAYDESFNGGVNDVFVTKLNTNGTGLVYSTFIGGNNDDQGWDIVVDSDGNAHITGFSFNNYVTTTGAFQTINEGFQDVIYSKLNSNGTQLLYSTYIGGIDLDYSYSIALDNFGNVYLAGRTNSPNYDVTPGAYETNFVNNASDYVFVTKLCTGTFINLTLGSAIGTDNQTICTGSSISTITYNAVNATNATVSGLPAGVTANYNSGVLTISGTPTVNGTFDYVVTAAGGCGNPIAFGTITINSLPASVNLSSATGTNNQTICDGASITNITYSVSNATGATVSGLPTGVTGNYNSGVLTISGTPTATGTFNYTVTPTGGCGNATATGTIQVNVCTGINEEKNTGNVVIYPNPAGAQFTIANAEIGTRVSVIDITGKVIFTEIVNSNTHVISTKDLVNGIYFVQLENNGQISQKKLVVNK